MLYSRTHVIEWGECDAMGIVFYPNYFRWMDATFHAFTRTMGFDQFFLKDNHAIEGTPLVDVGCTFKAPARCYQELLIELRVTDLGRSSLHLAYRFTIGDRMKAEGFEKRAFVAAKHGEIRAAEIPPDLRAKLKRYHV